MTRIATYLVLLGLSLSFVQGGLVTTAAAAAGSNQTTTGGYNLTFSVKGVQSNKGVLMAALFSDEKIMTKCVDDMLNKIPCVPAKSGFFKPDSNKTVNSITFDNLAKGKYAAIVFQDLNGDGTLNTNFLGMPLEPYAFSKNAIGLFGPANFKQASFNLAGDRTMTLYIGYDGGANLKGDLK